MTNTFCILMETVLRRKKTEKTESRLRKRRLMSRKEAFMLLPHFITAKVKNLDLSRFRSGSANQNA